MGCGLGRNTSHSRPRLGVIAGQHASATRDVIRDEARHKTNQRGRTRTHPRIFSPVDMVCCQAQTQGNGRWNKTPNQVRLSPILDRGEVLNKASGESRREEAGNGLCQPNSNRNRESLLTVNCQFQAAIEDG